MNGLIQRSLNWNPTPITLPQLSKQMLEELIPGPGGAGWIALKKLPQQP